MVNIIPYWGRLRSAVYGYTSFALRSFPEVQKKGSLKKLAMGNHLMPGIRKFIGSNIRISGFLCKFAKSLVG